MGEDEGDADPVVLKDAVELGVALALAEPDCEVCALKVELALAVALADDEGADEVLPVGVCELEAEADDVCDADGGGLPEAVGVGLAVPDSVDEPLSELLALEDVLAVGVAPDELEAVAVDEPDGEAVDDGLWDGGGLPDEVPVDVGDVETVALAD